MNRLQIVASNQTFTDSTIKDNSFQVEYSSVVQCNNCTIPGNQNQSQQNLYGCSELPLLIDITKGAMVIADGLNVVNGTQLHPYAVQIQRQPEAVTAPSNKPTITASLLLSDVFNRVCLGASGSLALSFVTQDARNATCASDETRRWHRRGDTTTMDQVVCNVSGGELNVSPFLPCSLGFNQGHEGQPVQILAEGRGSLGSLQSALSSTITIQDCSQLSFTSGLYHCPCSDSRCQCQGTYKSDDFVCRAKPETPQWYQHWWTWLIIVIAVVCVIILLVLGQRYWKQRRQQRSTALGVSLSYILGDFLKDALAAAQKVDTSNRNPEFPFDPNDPCFHDIAPILCYGPEAMGHGVTCPRDGQPDCAYVDALDREGQAGRANIYLSWVWS